MESLNPCIIVYPILLWRTDTQHTCLPSPLRRHPSCCKSTEYMACPIAECRTRWVLEIIWKSLFHVFVQSWLLTTMNRSTVTHVISHLYILPIPTLKMSQCVTLSYVDRINVRLVFVMQNRNTVVCSVPIVLFISTLNSTENSCLIYSRFTWDETLSLELGTWSMDHGSWMLDYMAYGIAGRWHKRSRSAMFLKLLSNIILF